MLIETLAKPRKTFQPFLLLNWDYFVRTLFGGRVEMDNLHSVKCTINIIGILYFSKRLHCSRRTDRLMTSTKPPQRREDQKHHQKTDTLICGNGDQAEQRAAAKTGAVWDDAQWEESGARSTSK